MPTTQFQPQCNSAPKEDYDRPTDLQQSTHGSRDRELAFWKQARYRPVFDRARPRLQRRARCARDGAPKKLTYARFARIVDGSDGRTYIAEFTTYGHITIMCGDMKFSKESVFPGDPRYAALVELFTREPGK